MYLEQHLRKDFPAGVRERGLFIFKSRKVSIVAGNQWKVKATVQGTMLYTVTLSQEDDGIDARCDCPYYFSDGLCKHIWATLLAADQKNLLQRGYNPARPRPTESLFSNELEGVRGPGWGKTAPASASLPARKRLDPTWREMISQLQRQSPARTSTEWPATNEIYYIIDGARSKGDFGLQLEVAWRELKKNGGWGKLKTNGILRAAIPHIPDLSDREALLMLGGVSDNYSFGTSSLSSNFRLPFSLAKMLLPKLCATGHCRFRSDPSIPIENQTPLVWDDGPPWQFRMRLAAEEKSWAVQGYLQRGEETMELNEVGLAIEDGLLFARGRVSQLEHGGNFSWVPFMRDSPNMKVPVKHANDFLAEMLNQPGIPPVDWPAELHFEQTNPTPRPHLKLEKTQHYWRNEDALWASLAFNYDGHMIPVDHVSTGIYEPQGRRFLNRDMPAERAAVERLNSLGLKRITSYFGSIPDSHGRWEVPPKKIPKVIRDLVVDGWQIESEGRLFRNAGEFTAELTSGIDWFELHAAVQYGSEKIQLPALLRALERGDNMVSLRDGSYGLIPDELREKYGLFARMGRKNGDHVRFSRAQAGLLDVLLAGREEIRVDEVFNHVRTELQSFEGIAPAAQPPGFVGQLRDYQLEGLAWMQFLQRFGFGGCLADDMGVGKTPQVLALLETRRDLRKNNEVGPSLVVAPRSVVYNWQRESERFTPQLRVLDYTGVGRAKHLERFQDYDVIITTYGTLRRDAATFRDIRFDYIILDEAQAIKNASTESAKAARLLQGNHRLALSGTPVENHLGDLWSLFEFLNPGMLGAAAVFQNASEGLRNPDEEGRNILAGAVRPFILRRTKSEVARELPPKTEQTLYCELDADQRKLYNELRDHYRASLLNRIDRDGMSRSRMHVLEALLRLRQAACHPGLIDAERAGEPSAKLEALLPQLNELREEGHKALVFSQFTKFLGILRALLDEAGIPYEYLDGQTRDREARVNRFQDDPDCKLFLVSLKAGGVGLNLCAAEYVFLLDPWWNPAVEAQAIDRAHRIGQTSPVFAYRLIARETVEEKVVELQNTKRDLADAIIRADTRLVSSLKREDLELLLS